MHCGPTCPSTRRRCKIDILWDSPDGEQGRCVSGNDHGPVFRLLPTAFCLLPSAYFLSYGWVRKIGSPILPSYLGR